MTGEQKRYVMYGVLLALGMLALVFMVGSLFAQEPGNPIRDAKQLPPTTALALALLSAVTAWLSEKAYNGLKTLVPWWDARPSGWHLIAAPGFNFLFGAASAGSGAAMLTDNSGALAGLVGGALNVLVAGGIFRAEKAKTNVDATAVLEDTRAEA